MKCDKCNQEIPSISMISELCKAQTAYNDLSERFEIAHNFIKKIVYDWDCNPNQAAAILNELKR